MREQDIYLRDTVCPETKITEYRSSIYVLQHYVYLCKGYCRIVELVDLYKIQ